LSSVEEAVARVLAGDAAAFERIVAEFGDRLVRMSARMLGSAADAEDVVQEAFVKAYGAMTRGEFDRRSRVETWLYRIVVNATLDAKRARARRAWITTGDDAAIAAASGDAASAEAHVALRELSELLGALPEEQQVALHLKAIEGFSAAEIAAIVGASEGAVEQRLVRARVALRAKLRREGDDDDDEEERGGSE
jgi:RNA polymerase sigma-70 factor (ECF subfamily)